MIFTLRKTGYNSTMKRWYLFVFLFSVTLIAFDRVFGLDPLRNGIQRITAPVSFGLYTVGYTITDASTFVVSLPYVHKENILLLQNNDAMRAQLVRFSELERENQILRRELGVAGVRTSPKILARSMGIQEYGNDIVLIVDKGGDDSVVIGDIAIVDDKLIGRVVQVLPSQAYVIPIVSVNSKIPAYIQAEGSAVTNGLVVGKFNSRLVLSEILQADTVQKGDIVVSSGEGGLFPSGLVLGVVEEVESTGTEIFKSALLNTNWELSAIKSVFIQHP
ncbi:hypothetical protein CO180_00430 [candidate division WWE3 bacterium CG_4_9_14_3_um_filter_41_6]|uniref:Cell shape-determining protein MreC n=1 Tax=candidate division WWE3 bacterium CG_4_10_14_0_2_um_filter_41_14 TaxID=1975072 RepID=A0A2M7TEH9_UNCKA|nr:MAG: hypothetical protein COY32_07205 [candidate division WWE3 bacterium CG_4_10_14_0_2_um_filter_41_14]PJA39569.1 MAG: hypothetical protein CO180_00430 [candidate division WWE3 bacterium CG_4_9_14_3_um_filter_41_6]